MDGPSEIPPTPPYSRDASTVGAGANPSAGLAPSFVGGPAPTPAAGIACGLFMPPRANPAGAPPAMKTRKAVVKRPLAAAGAKRRKEAPAKRPKPSTAAPEAGDAPAPAHAPPPPPPPPAGDAHTEFFPPGADAAADATDVFVKMPKYDFSFFFVVHCKQMCKHV